MARPSAARFLVLALALALPVASRAQAPSPGAPPAGGAAAAGAAGEKAPGPTAGAAADDGIEEVEDVEVEGVATVPAGGEGGEAGAVRGGLLDVLGRLHVAVVHLPIGWMLMVLLLDLLAFALRRRELEAAGLWALGAALLSFLPGIATGLLREDSVSQAPAVQSLVDTHETLVFAAAGVAAVAFAWRLAFRTRLDGARKAPYLLLVGLASLLVAVAGHWGGKVAWGPDNLPF